MRKWKVFWGVLLVAATLFGQKAEKQTVVGIAEEFHELPWYEEQARLWKIEIDQNPKNEEAWMNYYQAKRAILHKNGGNPHGKSSPAMQVVNEMEEHIPQTFTFNYCKGNQLGKDEGWGAYNIKAHEINPEDARVYDNLVVYYEMQGDLAKRKAINEKWKAKKTYSPGLLSFGYNVLVSLEEKAVVLTTGDNDTYPLWMLQDADGIRKDVIVANTYMIKDESYRNLLFKRMGVNVTLAEQKALKMDGKSDQKDLEYFVRSFVKTVHAKGIPIYAAATTQAQNDEVLKKNFYNVGLVSKYSEGSFDQYAFLQRNLMNRYVWDYLKHDFFNESIPVLVSFANDNYVPGLLVLRDHFRAGEDQAGVQFCEEILLKIAEKSRMKALILKYLNE